MGKFVGDFNMDDIICAKILPQTIARAKICTYNDTHIKILTNLLMKKERIWSYVKETTPHLRNNQPRTCI